MDVRRRLIEMRKKFEVEGFDVLIRSTYLLMRSNLTDKGLNTSRADVSPDVS
jgi:hypothetical protein